MGLRIDVRQLQREFGRKRDRIRASAFRPELQKYAGRVLASAVKATPARSLSKITTAQSKQYHYRVNYIPSVHETGDPMLIVNGAGEMWLHAGGRWYSPYRQLPDELQGILDSLITERDRRLSTSRAEFIRERAQARFLYKRAWMEVGQSLGIPVAVDPLVAQAHSRHNPPKQPPKGYGQWRGGKNVLSIVVHTPLHDRPSRYITFNARDILSKASTRHYPDFIAEVTLKLNRLLVSK